MQTVWTIYKQYKNLDAAHWLIGWDDFKTAVMHLYRTREFLKAYFPCDGSSLLRKCLASFTKKELFSLVHGFSKNFTLQFYYTPANYWVGCYIYYDSDSKDIEYSNIKA